MDVLTDHYAVLGLPSGEEGAKLSEKEITKAYKKRALELHPDKRPNDRDKAHADIQLLNASHAVLKDQKKRKTFDDHIRPQLEKEHRHSQHDSKKQKMMSDLDRKERGNFTVDAEAKARQEEEDDRTWRKFKEEVATIRAECAARDQAARTAKFESPTENSRSGTKAKDSTSVLDKERVLKVSWEKSGVDYSARKLRMLFEKFGEVEDVVIRHTKKKGSARVVMSSKDAVASSTSFVLGDISNPLLVLPLQPMEPTGFSKSQEHEIPRAAAPFGTDHKSFEAYVLDKLKKAGEKQKLSSKAGS